MFIRSNKLGKSLTDLVDCASSQCSDFRDPVVAAIQICGVATRVAEPSGLEAAATLRLTFPYTTTPQHSLPSNCAVACRKNCRVPTIPIVFQFRKTTSKPITIGFASTKVCKYDLRVAGGGSR